MSIPEGYVSVPLLQVLREQGDILANEAANEIELLKAEIEALKLEIRILKDKT